MKARQMFLSFCLMLAIALPPALAIPPPDPNTTIWDGSAWDNGEPNANMDVVIGSGTFTTSINSNFHCKNLTIESGATLVIVSGDTISVSGVVTNNGTITIMAILCCAVAARILYKISTEIATKPYRLAHSAGYKTT